MTMPHPRGQSTRVITDSMIRLSAVRQDTTDLIADVHQALDAVIA
jgi:O-acetylhomoserine/O-acetylserine sulfhydrylase-like pyridoxal-dependent enzyme